MNQSKNDIKVILFNIHNSDLHDFSSDYIQRKLSDNLRLSYILGFLKKNGITGEIFNSIYDDVAFSKLKNKIKSSSPQLIIFSVNYLGLTSNFIDTLSYIKSIKKCFPNIHISLEGTFSTLNYHSILKKYKHLINSVVVGEAENVSFKLINSLLSSKNFNNISGLAFNKNNIIKLNPNFLPIKNLDELPFPDRKNLSKVLNFGGVIQMQISRGCGSACNFCYLNEYYQSNKICQRRERSVHNIIKEIKSVIKKNKVNEIWFVDEDFIGFNQNSQKKAINIASSIIKNKILVKLIGQTSARNINSNVLLQLKKAGLKKIFVGIESGSQDFLNYLKKDLTLEQIKKSLSIIDKIGVFCEIGFIMFYKKTTISSIKQDIKFLSEQCIKNKKGYIQIYNLNLLVAKPNQYISDINDKKINILKPNIKLIYLGISLFSLQTRKLNNLIRELSINDETDITLRLIHYNNISILSCLKKIIDYVNLNKDKSEEEKILDIVNSELKKLQHLIKINSNISQNSRFTSILGEIQ